MTDERDPGGASGAAVGALFRAVEDLRTDMREDIGHLRDDVREDNAQLEHRVMGALTDFAVSHGREHTSERESSLAAHRRFDDFLRNAELTQARKDGALGVFRFLLEGISAHYKPITAVLLAAGGAALALAGNIRFEVVVR